MPFIMLMAITGLVILYTQPLQALFGGERYEVSKASSAVPYEVQAKAAQSRYPKASLTGVITPRNATSPSIFSIDDGSTSGQQVFVNPHNGQVLGTEKPGSGLVGWANRMHGYLNINSVKLQLPTVSAFFDGGAIMRPYVVGDMVLELLGVWTLVLVLSGICLWWPRRSKAATEIRLASGSKNLVATSGSGVVGPPGKRLRFGIRRGTTGRAKWRDLHGFSGVLLLGAMLLTIISGMGWSAYWGPNFTALANKISPNSWTDTPTSSLGKVGDLDVLGNRISWNTGDRPIPASYATATNGLLPSALDLDVVASEAKKQGMKPGFKINFPKNLPAVAGESGKATSGPVYGSFTVSNSWPRKTNEARDIHLDQFSGKKLAEQNAYGYGAASYGLDTLVSTHMGTQFGLLSRIMMTALCVLSIWSVTSALVMFTKRRRPGTSGLPRRPVDVKLSRRITIIAAVMAVVFPLWGACAGVVLGLDRFLLRRNLRLRSVFGQR